MTSYSFRAEKEKGRGVLSAGGGQPTAGGVPATQIASYQDHSKHVKKRNGILPGIPNLFQHGSVIKIWSGKTMVNN